MTAVALWRSLWRQPDATRPETRQPDATTVPYAGTVASPNCPDETIVARVLAGDREQFALLVNRYQAALYRHAVGLVLDHDVARDMVQDAFVRAYQRLDSCRDAARFRAWLFRTLRNRCLDHLKEARRHDCALDDDAALADASGAPDAVLERDGIRVELVRALRRLPAGQRDALMMRCVHGLGYEQMAELLGISVSALKMRVLRAKQTLAGALAGRL